ncbi:MAG: hypothetical protein U0746_18185 [Gemmataceae bacterium]
MRTATWVTGLAILLALATRSTADDKTGLDNDGFIQKWLVLAPIPFADGDSGNDSFKKPQIKDEAKLKPKAGEKVKVGKQELTWKKHTSKGHMLDFNAVLGNETEDSVGYAVTYITVPQEMKAVRMKTGSDDHLRVYLNGKEAFKYEDERAGDKDQDTTEVTLRKGVNVLVAKVVNVKADWELCVRFMDKDDKPLKGLQAKTEE